MEFLLNTIILGIAAAIGLATYALLDILERTVSQKVAVSVACLFLILGVSYFITYGG